MIYLTVSISDIPHLQSLLLHCERVASTDKEIVACYPKELSTDFVQAIFSERTRKLDEVTWVHYRYIVFFG
jgi:hypothetical protein